MTDSDFDDLIHRGALLGAAMDASHAERLPDVVAGRYRIRKDRCLGRGAMGIVYEAEDGTHSGLVAIKFLRAEWSADMEMIKRLQAEIQTLAAIGKESQTHVLVPIDCNLDPDSGLYYIVMQLARGTPLHRVPMATVSSARLEQWMAGVAHGLSIIHKAGFRHGDIKPNHILVERDGSSKIIDFGSVARLDAPMGLGATAGYESPEQVQIRKTGLIVPITESTDIYSFGRVFAEAWQRWALSQRPMWRAVLCPRAPKGVRKILEACLQRHPQARRSAGQIVSALEQLERSRQKRRVAVLVSLAVCLLLAIATASALFRWYSTEHEAALGSQSTLNDERHNMLQTMREARHSTYVMAIRPSVLALQDIQLSGGPAAEYEDVLKKRRSAYVTLFMKQDAPRESLDGLVLLLFDAQRALARRAAPPADLGDPKWLAVAKRDGDLLLQTDLYELRGLELLLREKPDLAKAEFEAAQRLDQARAILHFRLAACASLMKDDLEVIRRLTRFLEMVGEPKSPRFLVLVRDAHWSRASRLLHAADDPAGAYADMTAFFTLHNKSVVKLPDKYIAHACQMLAETAYAVRRYDEAGIAYEKAIAFLKTSLAEMTDQDKLFMAYCYDGLVVTHGRPDANARISNEQLTLATKAAKAAQSLLPKENTSQPFVVQRAKVLHHIGSAVNKAQGDKVRETAATILKQAVAAFETIPLDQLAEADQFAYAHALVDMGLAIHRERGLSARIELSRRGVELMLRLSHQNRRHVPTLLYAAISLGFLLEDQIAAFERENLDDKRAQTITDALNLCRDLETLFPAKCPPGIEEHRLDYLQLLHRLHWFRCGVLAKDEAVARTQGKAYVELFAGPAHQASQLALSQSELERLTKMLAEVVDHLGGQYLASLDKATGEAVSNGFGRIDKDQATKLTATICAAVAAFRSREGDYVEAVKLQQRAIALAAGDDEAMRLAIDLARYQDGKAFERR